MRYGWAVTTALPFDIISDVEDFHDAFKGNPGDVKGFNELAPDWEKINISFFGLSSPESCHRERLNV